MLDALGMLANSEYTNAGELLGLDNYDDELMGYLASLDAVNRQKVMQKINKKQIPSKGSRAEMESSSENFPSISRRVC